MSFVRVNGLRLHVQEIGSGQPLFLTHGLLLDNLASWMFSAAASLAPARRVVLWDLRGHGRSDPAPGGYDAPTQARDLAALIDAVAPGRTVDLAGFSYGATIALRCALELGDRLGRLALIEAPLPPRRYEEFDELLAGDVEKLLAAMPPALRLEVLRSPRRAVKLAGAVRSLVRETSLLDDVRGEPALPDGALAGLDRPVLALYATGSPFLEDGRRLAGELPRVDFRTLEGSHRLLNERPAEVGAALNAFFGAGDTDGRCR